MKTNLFYVIIVLIILVITIGLQTCNKHQPHEPPVDVSPDTVVVVDTFHVHHDHEVVIIDTMFQNIICDIVDLTVQFTVIGDQSAPNVYHVLLNGVKVGEFVINDTFPEPTEVSFLFEFLGVIFGDEIAIRKISGSRAEVVESSIVDIKCSG